MPLGCHWWNQNHLYNVYNNDGNHEKCLGEKTVGCGWADVLGWKECLDTGGARVR